MQFIQPDTLIPDIYNPQSLNRFSYVTNSPIRYSDPTGHMDWEVEGGDYTPPNLDPDDYRDPHPWACGELPDDDEFNDLVGSDLPNSDDILSGDGEELTDAQLIGQVVTFAMIEVFILLPVDYGLVVLTADVAVACATGVVLACVAEIPILAVDLVVADFQISLANTIAQNVATGTRHEFEWIIILNLLEGVRGEP